MVCRMENDNNNNNELNGFDDFPVDESAFAPEVNERRTSQSSSIEGRDSKFKCWS